MSQPSFQSFADLFQSSEFIHRHVGISQDEKEAMLKAVGADSMASFIEQTVPASVRLSKELDLPLSMTEHDALAKLRGLAAIIRLAYLQSLRAMYLKTQAGTRLIPLIKRRLPKVA